MMRIFLARALVATVDSRGRPHFVTTKSKPTIIGTNETLCSNATGVYLPDT